VLTLSGLAAADSPINPSSRAQVAEMEMLTTKICSANRTLGAEFQAYLNGRILPRAINTTLITREKGRDVSSSTGQSSGDFAKRASLLHLMDT